MALHLRPVLPPPLAAKLAALGTRLGDRELEDVLADLSTLPANLIVRANQEIATAARLGWWQTQMGFSLGRLFGSSNEQQLLRKRPDYAWLFLFHPNGYVREAALDCINNPPTSPFFFSALAWRLNDWVGPVRQAAERCAERVLHQTVADVAANAALYLLDRRLAWGRWRPAFATPCGIRTSMSTCYALRLMRYSHQSELSPTSASFSAQPLGPSASNGHGSTRFMDCGGVFRN